MKRTKRRMTAFLPPTPCTPEMRQRVEAYAEKEGRSIAEVQRDALSLFFARIDTNGVNNDTERVKEQAS